MALSKLRRKTNRELSDEALALQGISSELFEFGEFEGCFGMDIKQFCAGYSIPIESHEPLANLCVFILEKTSVTPEESRLEGLDDVCSHLYNEIEDYCKVSATLDNLKSLFLIDLVNGRFNSLLNINAVYIDEPMTHPELNLFAMHCMEYSGSNLILDELSEVKYLNPYHWLDISNNIVRASGDMATATIYFDARGTLSHIGVKRNGTTEVLHSYDIMIDDTSGSGFKIVDKWGNDFELSRPTLSAVYKHAYLEHGGVLKW